MPLTIFDFDDLSMLHVVEDAKDASTHGIAAILEVKPQSVGTRLHHMRVHGLVERTTEGAWTVAADGRVILRKPRRIMEVRALAKQVARDDGLGWMARREWRRETR